MILPLLCSAFVCLSDHSVFLGHGGMEQKEHGASLEAVAAHQEVQRSVGGGNGWQHAAGPVCGVQCCGRYERCDLRARGYAFLLIMSKTI